MANAAKSRAYTSLLSPPRKYRVLQPCPGVSSREALWSLRHDPWPVEGMRVKLLAADVSCVTTVSLTRYVTMLLCTGSCMFCVTGDNCMLQGVLDVLCY